MEAEALRNPAVRAVVIAMREGDREAFFAAFTPSAKLTDDGHPQPLTEWADREIFQTQGLLRVDREERDGLELIGSFHSDQWDMETVWRFGISGGRVRRLDVAAL